MVNVWLVIGPREFFSTLITLEKETLPETIRQSDTLHVVFFFFFCSSAASLLL